MAKQKQVRLAINLLATGRHNAAWKTLPNPEKLSTDIDTFIEIAKIAERGKLDGIFLADGPGGVGEESFRRPFRALAPSVLIAALAMHTKNIGFVSTVPALYGNPATLAREIASLDQISKGRAAWNIITSQSAETLKIFGLEAELPQAEKYDKAEEYVSIVTQLWDSLPREALIADRASGIYIEQAKTRPIDYHGEYYRSAGLLGVPGYNGKRPVLVQAGASALSKEFGSKWADALFTSLDVTVEFLRLMLQPVVSRYARARYAVVAILCVMYFITYVERVNLSVAAPDLTRTLHLSKTELGFLFSVFAYPYAAMQILGGWFSDKYGPRVTLAVLGVIWSLATIWTDRVEGS